MSDSTNLVFIDLHSFSKKEEECESLEDIWMYSIRNMHRLKKCPDGIEGTELEELYNESYYAAWPAEKRAAYERSIMNRNDYGNILEERYEDGLAAGLAEGRAEVAKKMVEVGMDVEQICRLTGLTVADIQAIS